MSEDKRTEFAMAAVDLAGVFNTAFADAGVAGYSLQLTAPEGQSTGGGIQALQHITLVHEAGGVSIVVGHCNNVEKRADLRTYDHAAGLFRQRFPDAAFPVESGRYQALTDRIGEFFRNQSFQVGTARPPAAPSPQAGAAAPAKGGSSGLVYALVILALAIVAGLVYYFAFYEA